ncbi:glycosyltransferase [Plesiomonas shigelloides]|uniref:glycosyltransferase n=1 Tax=Plesiomonas shigelloides TaxID=703 RepID=UPI001C5A8ED6|nr:glycosyltransferase [Plesiomonas shigelloides]MBW3792555.1 glycosyltransferase [Plesiomonas shigelloides]
MNKSDVVAIVVTYNRKELLALTLNALLKQTFQPKNIIIIDNNSSDGTDIFVKSMEDEYSHIIYHNTGDNLGGAGGFHYGFNVAAEYQYDYLWLMDDDLEPSANCLQTMLSLQHEGIIQPIRFNLDGSCAELSPVKYDLDSVFRLNPKIACVLDVYDIESSDDCINIEGMPFEGPLISRSVVEKIGMPNPDFFIFYDDLDYAIKARNAGFTIKCSTKAKATRLLVNNQNNDLKSWKGYFMLRNLFYIYYQYGSNAFVKFKPFVIACGYILRCLLVGDFKQCKITWNAFLDSFALKNSSLYKPKSK